MTKEGIIIVTCAHQLVSLNLETKHSTTLLAQSQSFGRLDGAACSGPLFYFADALNHKIYVFDLISAEVSLIAGTGEPGHRDGPATHAKFNSPQKLTISSSSKRGTVLYVTQLNNAVRVIELSPGAGYHRVSTLAGNLTDSLNSGGYRDGSSHLASFEFPCGISALSLGHLYVADCDSKAIREIKLFNGQRSILGQREVNDIEITPSSSLSTSGGPGFIFRSTPSSGGSITPITDKESLVNRSILPLREEEKKEEDDLISRVASMEMQLKHINQSKDSVLTLKRVRNHERFDKPKLSYSTSPHSSLQRKPRTLHGQNSSFTASALLSLAQNNLSSTLSQDECLRSAFQNQSLQLFHETASIKQIRAVPSHSTMQTPKAEELRQRELRKQQIRVRTIGAKLTVTAISSVATSHAPAVRALLNMVLDMLHEWGGLALPQKKKGILYSNQECARFLKNPVLSQNLFTDVKLLRECWSQKIQALIDDKLKLFQKQGDVVTQHTFLRHFQSWLGEWKRLGSLIQTQKLIPNSSGQLLTPKQGASFILNHEEVEESRAQEYCSVQSTTSCRTPNTLSNSSTVKEISSIQDERIQKLREELKRSKLENEKLKEEKRRIQEEKQNLREEVDQLKSKMRTFLSQVKRVAMF